MNEELSKIRELRGYKEVISLKPEKISDERMTEILYELNSNMAELYHTNFSKEYNEQDFINKLIENIYIILNMFNEMHIYPGYFFRKVFEMNSKYLERKIEYESRDDEIHNDNKIKGDYVFFKDTNLQAWVSREIKGGLEKGYYRIQAYPKTNISDAFLEILALFQKYNIPYKITTKEECQKVFNNIYINYSNIIGTLTNSVLEFVDIECLCRILYDYITFFVSIGVNPKNKLDEYIVSKSNEIKNVK